MFHGDAATTFRTPLRSIKTDAPLFVPRRDQPVLPLPASRALQSPSSRRSRCGTTLESTPEDGKHCDVWSTGSDEASTWYAESEASMMTPSMWCGLTSSVASVCSEPVDEAFYMEDFQDPLTFQNDASQVMYYVGSFVMQDCYSSSSPPTQQGGGSLAAGWRRPPPTPPLKASPKSWVAQRSARQGMDVDQRVACLVKSTMNKLSVENFPRLSEQLMQCVKTEKHMKHLVSVVFDAAAAQHHFIDMYADLAVSLHKHFEQHPVGGARGGKNVSFKRLLILECSQALARSSQEPTDKETAMKYKDQTLGSMKLVGALCARGLLASNVLLMVSEHLLSADTAEMLESLAALLTIAGPVYDTPEFQAHEVLTELFDSLRDIAGSTRHDTRTRCLLRDVLDLRSKGWEKQASHKKMEVPMKLAEVAQAT